MISQFFILSPRGDTIIMRDYLGNVPKVGSSPSLIIIGLSDLHSHSPSNLNSARLLGHSW